MPSAYGQRQMRKRRRDSRERGRSPCRPSWVRDRSCQSGARYPLRRQSPGSSCRDENASASTETSDIPGFYYDKERKCYFRLLPGHNNFNPLTTESIRRREPTCRAAHVHRRSAVALLDDLRSGFLSEDAFRRKVAEQRLSELKPALKQSMSEGDPDGESRRHDGCAFLLPRSETSELVALCFDEDSAGGAAETLELVKWKLETKQPDDDAGFRRAFLRKARSSWRFPGKVTDACLAETERRVDCALFCCVGRLNTSSKAVMVPLADPLFHDPDDSEFHISFELGRSAVWSCAWSASTQSVAFGLEGKSLVMDGFTMAQHHIHTKKQNSLAVCFSATGKELYSGTNRSAIVCSDLRESVDRHCTYSFPVTAPVTHMQLLPEHMLLISGHQNQLCTIDLRARKCLQTFRGHVNEHSKIHAAIDVDEDVLCSAGQDKVVRLWSLSAGKLQKEIYPERHWKSSDLAAAWFCSSPKMVSPALVIAAKNEMVVYQS